MFPNPQDALPLPPRPNLERYKKLAKELIKACKSSDENATGDWAEQWIRALAKLAGWKNTHRALARMGRWTDEVEEFARRKFLGGEPADRTCALADAQFVIARSHGSLRRTLAIESQLGLPLTCRGPLLTTATASVFFLRARPISNSF